MNQKNDMESFDPSPLMDDELQRELDAALGEKSLDELIDESTAAPPEAPADDDSKASSESDTSGDDDVHLKLVRGRISAIREDDVFIELPGIGAKTQGIIALKQFDRPPRVGSIMDFIIDRVDDAEGLTHLSREGAITHATWEQLNKGDNVEVRVVGTNKGGLEVEMVGNIKGFMPASQVSMQHVDDLEQFVGQKLPAKVQEVHRKKKNVVVSHRAFLEVERKRNEKKTLAELEVDQIREGKVLKLMEFGAFVDLGGVDGLIHVSDMSYSRVEKPEDFVKVGETVTVKVLKIDKDKNRISLGLKQTQPDPWQSFADQLAPGQEIEGTVVRLENFGAFVELQPGVDGLLPVSEMSWTRVNHPKDLVKQGDKIRVKVNSIDTDKRRLSLSLKGMSEDPWIGAEAKYPASSIVDATVSSITDFGAFVAITNGVEGLVHISELSDRRVNAVTDVLKVGQQEKFRILEIDEENRRVRLSLRQVKELDPERKPRAPKEKFPSEYTAKPKKRDENLKGGMGKSGALGTGLGDLKL